MDSNKEKTIGEIRALEKNLMRLHTLEELEASPELLNELPEPERSMFLERRRALGDFVAENQQAMDALREELRETTATYNRIIQQATEITGRPKEEIEELLINDPEVNNISFGDFVALSITDDEKLALDGLLATIIKKSREENRTAKEIAQDLQEALENQTALVPFPFHSAVEQILLTSKRNAEIINGTAVIAAPNDVRIIVKEFDNLKGALSIGADKVLHVALMEFARNNQLNRSATEARQPRVIIPLKEYAELLKYDVKERPTATADEAQAEKKRVKMQLDNARRKIAKDIDVLYHISLEYHEGTSYDKVRLLDRSKFKRGNFELTFSQDIADALVNSHVISQYDTKLLGIDERHPNAYKIMRKLLEHYNQISNQRGKTHNRLKVENVLKVTDLPSYERVQATTRGHWQERIKEPFEENLEYLVKEGLLKGNYKYTHSKGKELTAQEVLDLTKYEDYIKLYLEFEPVNKNDNTKRIEKKEAEDKKRKDAVLKEKAKIEARREAKKDTKKKKQ